MNFCALTLCLAVTAQAPGQPVTPSAPRAVFDPNVQPAAPVAQAATRTADGRELKSVLRTSATTEEPARLAKSEEQLPPVESTAQRGSTAEVLEQALAAPPDGAIAGRPYSLFEVISRTGDRNQQIWSTKAYWKLVVAIADYNLSVDEYQRMEQLSATGGAADAALLQAAKSATAARVREAEIAAIAAQFELSDLLFLPPGEPLPIPSDTPHAGQYRTHFETLFAARIPPTRARLIDRTLPIRRELIDQRASAAKAATLATAAAEAAYQQGAGDMRSLLEAHQTLWQQRRGFLTAVRDYNHDIAEYALTVAQIGTNEAVLVSMLIKTPNMPTPGWPRNEPTPATPPAADGQVEPGQIQGWTPARSIEAAEENLQSDPAPVGANPSPFGRPRDQSSVLKGSDAGPTAAVAPAVPSSPGP